MVTKKVVKRGIKLFNSLRGPLCYNKEKTTSSIDPFVIFLKETSNDCHIYSKFHTEVLVCHRYFSQELLDATTKFINKNIPTID